MRKYLYLLMLIGSLVFSSLARGQQPTPEVWDQLDKYAKQMDARGRQSTSDQLPGVVKGMYESENFLLFSVWEKLLQRGGDEVAVALAHIIGPSTVSNPKIERIYYLIDTAFQSPNLIENPNNRNPDVSILLLESAKLRTNDPAMQAKIAALRIRLINLYNGR